MNNPQRTLPRPGIKAHAPRAWLLLTSGLVGAGCLGTPLAAEAGPEPVDTRVLPWDLIDCRIASGWLRVDAAPILPYLPEGFELATAARLPMMPSAAPVPRDAALLGFEIFDCPEATTVSGAMGTTAYGSFYIPVQPPEHLMGDAEAFFLKLDPVVPDARQRDLLAATGAIVHDGVAKWTPMTPAGFAGPAEGTLTFGEVGEMRIRAMPREEPRTYEGYALREFTPAANGTLVIWDAMWENHGTSNAQGTVEFPPGSFGAKIAGETRAEAQIVVGTWTFRGSITLPAAT